MANTNYLDKYFHGQGADMTINNIPRRNKTEYRSSILDGDYSNARTLALAEIESGEKENDKVKLALGRAMLQEVCKAEMELINKNIETKDFEVDLRDTLFSLELMVFDDNYYPLSKKFRNEILDTLTNYFLIRFKNDDRIRYALPYLVELVENGESKYRQIIFDIISEFPGRVYDEDKLKNSNYTQLISNGYSLLREGDKRGYEYLSEGLLDKLTEYLDMHKSDIDPKLDFVEELIFKMKSWGIELFLEQELDYEVLKCRKNKMTEIQTQATLKRLICEIATKLLDMNSGHFRSSNIINASRLLKLTPKYKITDTSELEKSIERCRIAYSRTAKH